MDYVSLPDLRRVVRGFDLRIDAARAISHVELAKSNGSLDTTASADLLAFFVYCANAVDKVRGGDGTRVKVVTA
jgi:hypothetical protein